MEITFITIHDLSAEAIILYSSDSIVDVLGYTPDEVVNSSTWEFFKGAELDGAKKVHGRSLEMDKASVLTYCDIKNRNGDWIRCECCFSIVYNVMVACTSIYRQGPAGDIRRGEAPIARRLFTSSPQDPRYHMLQHLSARFQQNAHEQTHEPRAALFLNRFTRTCTIMYATSGIEDVIGISGENMKGRSFYYCISEACLEDAVQCLETAKGNDSVAYLRFLFRDPRQDDQPSESPSEDDTDAEMTDAGASESEADENGSSNGTHHGNSAGPARAQQNHSVRDENVTPDSVHTANTSSSGVDSPSSPIEPPIELEAIVSCTSDGLVVCLRRARPILPDAMQDTVMPKPQIPAPPYTGFFAAPWGVQGAIYQPFAPPGFTPMAYPGMPHAFGGPPMPPPQPASTMNDLAFLKAIQECGVFAWDLVGINGTLADVARGHPTGRAAPPDGPSIWEPSSASDVSSSGRGTGSHSSIKSG
ncbi:hypothetical protein BT63DRAFT_126233 [Microthyrium microscopicum]|uniref:PAS domain-containing protein n=1 Tax=Microthyrium microscopicum TaxID=703497 RepID=A0A6A6TTK5_9PEZI|nr:hypothetical protein BT63DRAFT_126233 [Microthyrium microscopicum]